MIFAAILIVKVIDISSACVHRDQGKCYGDLGCFPITSEFFHPLFRPLNADPDTPEEINTTFLLFTERNPEKGQLINRHDEETIKTSNYDRQNPIKILIHGFQSSYDSLLEITKEILRINDVNVIMVDWSKGSQSDAELQGTIRSYNKACANARVVGKEIGLLINLLKDKYDAKSELVHVIGHSLGAQVAGYTGEMMNPKLGQITGLDPASPYFEKMPASIRLDPTDAQFVDIIHTNGIRVPYIGFGMAEPSGHVDFYPDGGHVVNDCDDPLSIIKLPFSTVISGALDIISCSHSKSINMYKESVNKQCPFTSYACDSIQKFKKVECYTCDRPGYDCRPMGYYTNQFPYDGLLYRKYYLTTTEEKHNLCAFHWVMEIVIADEQEEVNGNIYVSALGEKFNFTKHKMNQRTETYSPGQTYKYMMTFKRNPRNILSLNISWEKSVLESLDPNADDTLKIKSITVIPIEIIDQNERKDQTDIYCNKALQDIKIGKVIKVEPSSNC